MRQVGTQIRNEHLLRERREKIISAAVDVFHRKGFHVATTRDVAEESGITQSNLYNHIKTKSDILYLVCVSLMDAYRDALDEVARQVTEPRDVLILSIKSIVSIIYDRRKELQLLYNEVHSLDHSDRKSVVGMIAQLITRLQSAIGDYEAKYGATRLTNKRLAANLVSFLPAIISLRAWDLARHATREEQEEGVLEFILAGLGIVATQTSVPGAKLQD